MKKRHCHGTELKSNGRPINTSPQKIHRCHDARRDRDDNTTCPYAIEVDLPKEFYHGWVCTYEKK